MIVALYGNRHQQTHIDRIISLIEHIIGSGDSLVMHAKLAEYIVQLRPYANILLSSVSVVGNREPFEADLAVSIGGDGTFLRTTEWVGDREIPIIGVNTGHLGFLAPFTIDEVVDMIERFREGSVKVQQRSLLCVDLPGMELDIWPYALNEVALTKRDTASMVTVSATIDNLPLADYLCDGLIVATPTGSTAYNLSVGGPIVSPTAPDFVISPIAAHTLTMRPLVVSDESVVELRANSRVKSFRLAIDGRAVTLPCGVPIYISKARFVVRIVLKPEHNFYAALREKLLWGQNLTNK